MHKCTTLQTEILHDQYQTIVDKMGIENKEELKLQTEKQYCHYEERMEDYEEEKMKYLKKLAYEHNLELKELIRHGNLIYNNYRSEMMKISQMKLKEIEKQAEVNARLLQEELTRQKQLKKLKSSSVPRFRIVKAREKSRMAEEEVESLKFDDTPSISFTKGSLKNRYEGSLKKYRRRSTFKAQGRSVGNIFRKRKSKPVSVTVCVNDCKHIVVNL